MTVLREMILRGRGARSGLDGHNNKTYEFWCLDSRTTGCLTKARRHDAPMKKDIILMFLATLAVVALVFVTWAAIGFSIWIVGHSGVEDLLARDGKHTLLFLKDTFWSLGRGLLLAEIIGGIVFLWLLWQKIYRAGQS